MNREKKTTKKKKLIFVFGISLLLTFLCSGVEAVTAGNNFIHPLFLNSIVNPHSHLSVDVDEIDLTITTTESLTSNVISGNITVSNQKNSTSRRRAIIDD